MKINKLYYSAALFYLIALISYISYQYMQQRSELIEQIDTRLIECATLTDQFLSPSLHTPSMNANTLSPKQDVQNRLRLSKFSESMHAKYVYSFILQNGKIYFTSSSATPQELKTDQNISYYFDEYTDASPILYNAFKTRKMCFDESTDQWGHFRSVFIPHVSPTGRFYITGADIEISYIQQQLHDLLMYSFGEALFYILILLPFFIAYRIQQRAIHDELTQLVNERTFDLRERSEAVTLLLDNANQGFLSFGISLAVENEYSKKCLTIFDRSIEGERIGNLLYPNDRDKQEFFEQTLIAVFKEEDPIKVEAILSLLQHEFVLNHKAIHALYTLIGPTRFMVILTDITDKKNLEKNIENEHNTMKMVVSAISNSDEFFELLEEYQNFLEHRNTIVNNGKTPIYNLSELYRIIHTYKGLFSQKDFITTPKGLHKVESKLTSLLESNTISNETLQLLIDKIDFEGWLAKDTEIVSQILGKEFLEKKSGISMDNSIFENLYERIKQLIDAKPDECHELLDLLDLIQKLKYKPIREYFGSYPKYSEQIAHRLNKSLRPMEIISTTDYVVGDEFKPFAKSLIHIIRNSVDHGIESPDERVLIGKEEEGEITISIREAGDFIEIEVADDGQGIDIEKLKERAIEMGLKTASDIEQMSEDELYNLVFENYLSTKDEVNDLSGRGVGLASVRAEAEKLGGACRILSKAGEGSRFVFTLPKKTFRKGSNGTGTIT
ncbi:MAG: ATP-binding protein [Campylobacterales bacterium]|nr:ATP-binding protein [Campylobacterales bacterium]